MTEVRLGRVADFFLGRVTKFFFFGSARRNYFMGRAANNRFGTRGANFVLFVEVRFFCDIHIRLERAAQI